MNRRTFGKIIAGLFATPLGFLGKKLEIITDATKGSKRGVFVLSDTVEWPVYNWGEIDGEPTLRITNSPFHEDGYHNFKDGPFIPPLKRKGNHGTMA